MKTVFIDGKAGTTGLRIEERLFNRKDVTIVSLPEEFRKDAGKRKEIINDSDIVFLCLPDAAAIDAVAMVENPNVTIIDASTAHRTKDDWAYGFPELSSAFREKVVSSKRIAVPGCHASGFIALVYPLIENGILDKSTLLTAHSITGYSGGGKGMIAEYADANRSSLLNAPRQYGISQAHKHLPEMVKMTCLENAPAFMPIVADFYSGMEVTVPLFANQIKGGMAAIKEVYRNKYQGPIVTFKENADEGGFLSAGALSGKDSMEIQVHGNEERILLVARYDNLGKGASGAAVECLNYKLGCLPTETLVL
ncbi:MAG: N-acetyl-gamma-glutamyl-phosphate reductase [Clostridiales bacterium]|nr:N-acetyl-gamma-glutamyl-phosphate reductase [Clostridiales bacterium]